MIGVISRQACPNRTCTLHARKKSISFIADLTDQQIAGDTTAVGRFIDVERGQTLAETYLHRLESGEVKCNGCSNLVRVYLDMDAALRSGQVDRDRYMDYQLYGDTPPDNPQRIGAGPLANGERENLHREFPVSFSPPQRQAFDLDTFDLSTPDMPADNEQPQPRVQPHIRQAPPDTSDDSNSFGGFF